MYSFRLFIVACGLLLFCSCHNSLTQYQQSIQEKICGSIPAGLAEVAESDREELILAANDSDFEGLTAVILTLPVESPLLSGKYKWSVPNSGWSLVEALASYLDKYGTAVSSKDVVLHIDREASSQSLLVGNMMIETEYGLKAKVNFRAKVAEGDVNLLELSVPRRENSNKKGYVLFKKSKQTESQ